MTYFDILIIKASQRSRFPKTSATNLTTNSSPRSAGSSSQHTSRTASCMLKSSWPVHISIHNEDTLRIFQRSRFYGRRKKSMSPLTVLSCTSSAINELQPRCPLPPAPKPHFHAGAAPSAQLVLTRLTRSMHSFGCWLGAC